jgi:hypothetical protein
VKEFVWSFWKKWVKSLLKVSSACPNTPVNPWERIHIPLRETSSVENIIIYEKLRTPTSKPYLVEDGYSSAIQKLMGGGGTDTDSMVIA